MMTQKRKTNPNYVIEQLTKLGPIIAGESFPLLKSDEITYRLNGRKLDNKAICVNGRFVEGIVDVVNSCYLNINRVKEVIKM